MPTIWFCLVAFLLAGYVILDGFDLGAGILHLFVAKTEPERRAVLASIGPVWDGNEVWLIAAGGTLYFAFPGLYASSFSGFYLALMIVLWLLILRGIAIEVRHRLTNELWHAFWDVVFAGASALLAIFYGVALGNVVRGVPLDSDGYFFLPLWANLRTGTEVGLIDWYTILIGLAAFTALTLHGALWVSLKTEGEVQGRAEKLAGTFWPIAVAAAIAISAASFEVQPHLSASFHDRPWGLLLPVFSVAGLLAVPFFRARANGLAAFLSSCASLFGLLGSAAFGLYPNVLPSNVNAARSLTVSSVAAAPYGLRIGLFWFVPALALALAYSTFVYRHSAGKVQVQP